MRLVKRKHQVYILLCLSLFSMLIIYRMNIDYKGIYVQKERRIDGCPLPDFGDPAKFFSPFPDPNKFNCKNSHMPILVTLDEGLVHLVESANCTYQCVTWNSDFSVRFDKPRSINDKMVIPCSYFIVECGNKHQFVYTVYKDEDLIRRTRKASSDQYDVMIVTIDSMSYRAWKFYLPQTYKMVHEELGGVGFEKYNIVGDGTTANIHALLTGTKDIETYEARKRMRNAKYIDDFNWVWRDFKANNYVTLFQEEESSYGTFQYRLKGFEKQPTDFYGRVGMMVAEQDFVKNYVCFGQRFFPEVQLEMLRNFSRVYRDSNTFSFSILTHLSHNNNRYVNVIDGYLARFIQEQRLLYPNKLIILSADHGCRVGESRLKIEGKYEERLPYLSILLPKNLQKKYQGNLASNSHTLITAIDVHATIMHVLYGMEFHNNATGGTETRRKRHRSLLLPLPRNRTCEDVDLPPHWCACLQWHKIDTKKHEKMLNSVGKQIVSQIQNYTNPWRNICSPLKFSRVIEASLMNIRSSILAFKERKDEDGYIADMSDTMKEDRQWMRLIISVKPFEAQFEITAGFNSKINPIKIEKLDYRTITRMDQYAPYVKCLTEDNLESIKLDPIKNPVSDIRKFCICKSALP